MRVRALLRSTTTRTVASGIALAVTVGAFAVVAFSSTGYPLSKVDLNDGAAWVTNQDLGRLGRFNKAVGQLDSDLITSRTAESDIDVVQEAGTVFAVDHGARLLRRVDVAKVVLDDGGVDLPERSAVALGGGTVAILDQATGKLWVRSADAVATLSLPAAAPTAQVGAEAAVAVAVDGTVFAVSASQGVLVTVTGGADGHPRVVSRRLGMTAASMLVTAVGNQPVVVAEGRLVLPDGRTVAVPSSAVLQQAGPVYGLVYVATDSSLLGISLSTGQTTTVYSNGAGRPSAPVYQNSCVYAAWAGSATYLRRCVGAPEEKPRPLQGLPADPNLVFRVNRDVIVLNEVAIGGVYVYKRGGQDLGNWQALRPRPNPARTHAGKPPPGGNRQNHQPVAKPDSYGARPGDASVLHVLDNDGDADGDVLIIGSVSGLDAGAGRLAIVANGQALQFTASVTWRQAAHFTYTINDGHGGTSTGKVTMTARGTTENRSPRQLGHGTAVTVARGGTVSANVLVDWRDPDGDPLTVTDATTKSPDAVQFTADGKITFVDGDTGTGSKTVAVTVNDGHRAVTADLAIKVVNVGTGAIGANNDRMTGVVGQAISIHPLDNDTDPNTTVPNPDAQLRLTKASRATAGTTVTPAAESNTIRFVASAAQTYYVSYEVTDGVKTGKAKIRVDVVAPSTANPPVAVTDRAILRGTVPAEVDVLSNDIDASGNVLVVQSVSTPDGSGVSVAVVGHRWLRITAVQPGTGTVTLHYVVSDGGGSDTGAVDVTRLPSSADDQPPTPYNDTAVVRAGDVTTINVLANDTDPEGEHLTLSSTVVPSDQRGHWIAAGRTIRFLAPSKPGTAVANYSVSDPEGRSTIAQVTVTILAAGTVEQPPQPTTVQARTFAGTIVRIPIPLAGVDPDGDSVVLIGATDAPRLGRVIEQGAGYFVYQAYARSSGTDHFSYRLEDTFGARGTGTVRVGVIAKPVEDAAPTAVEDDYTVAPGATVRIPVLVNDSDLDGDPLRVESLGPLNPDLPAGTRLDGSTITMRAGTHNGDVVQVQYGVSDGRGQRATATVAITSRTGANVSPVAVDDPVPAPPSGATAVTVDVLANDYDIDGGAGDLTVAAMDSASEHPSQVSAGKLRVHLTAFPRQIAYQITDAHGAVAVAFVAVPGSDNDLPRLDPHAPGLQVTAGGTLAVDLTTQILDPAGRPFRLTDAAGISTSPVPGLASRGLRTTGLTLVSVGAYTGPAGLVVEVTDAPSSGDIARRTASITMPVTIVPPAGAIPVFSCPTARPRAGALPVTVNLATCVTGISPQAAEKLSFSAPGGAPRGVAVKLVGATLSLSADESAKTGVRSRLTFTVTDAAGRSGPASLDVVVSDAPPAIATSDTVNGMRAGTQVRVHVLGNDINPFPGRPMRVVGVRVISGGVTAISGDSEVVVTAPGSYHGRATLIYRLRDATNDPKRDVEGQIVVNVIGKPDAPGTPHLRGVGDGNAVLSWSEPSGNGAPITGYLVTGSRSFSQRCPITVCKLTGLTNGATYSFRVQAINEVGTSQPGPSLGSVEPDVQPDQPEPPTTKFGDSSMALTWSAPHSAGSAIRYYLVEISPPVAGARKSTGTSLVWTGLANGTSYTFRVRAYNHSPNPSDWSGYSAGDIPAKAPGQPIAPTAAGRDDGIGKQMTVNWQAPVTNGAPITGYELTVIRAGTVVDTIAEDGDATRQTVKVDNGVGYTYRITATNKAGTSVVSPASAAVQAHGKPARVSSFTVTDNSGGTGYDGRIHFDVSPPNDNGLAITNYDFNYTNGTSVDASSSSATGFLAGLGNGTDYHVRVRACNDMCGDWSSLSGTVTPYGPVPTPNAGAGKNGSRQVQVSWSSGGTNGRALNRVEISVDGGGWENVGTGAGSRDVGNGPNETHSIRVRAYDTAGQVSNENSASATTDPPSVTVTKGTFTSHPGCGSCNYINVQLFNFPSNASFTCVFDSETGNVGFLNLNGNVDGSGNTGVVRSDDWYGYPNKWVSATCNGVRGQVDHW